MINKNDDRHAGGRWQRALDNPYLLLAFASLCWSGNHVIGRAIGGHVPPLGLSTVRWLIPAFVLWPFAREHLRRDWPEIKAHWRMMLWLGITGGALFSALQYIGLQYTAALNVSVLNSLVPVLIVAAGALLFHDRIRAAQTIGIAASLAGVLVIVSHGSIEALSALAFSHGDLIILANMAIFSVYAAYLRLRPKIHGLSFIFLLSVISAVLTFPFFVAESLSGFTFKADVETAIAIAYVSIFPSVIAFAAWNRGVEIIGANRAGPFLHLVPIYTAVLSTLLLGEHLALFHIAGFALILCGVWLASTNPRLSKSL
ncbi:MAG TPA: DMT family transporter [Pseudolabrys sp.]|nr:DMT family transporter [Pseudolabrys sp.]